VILVGICGSFFKEKYDAFSTFKTFKTEMEKEIGKVVKVIWIKQ
jgi:hypothetical protein